MYNKQRNIGFIMLGVRAVTGKQCKIQVKTMAGVESGSITETKEGKLKKKVEEYQ
jgi:hypothetical protein